MIPSRDVYLPLYEGLFVGICSARQAVSVSAAGSRNGSLGLSGAASQAKPAGDESGGSCEFHSKGIAKHATSETYGNQVDEPLPRAGTTISWKKIRPSGMRLQPINEVSLPSIKAGARSRSG